ncbi:hypothetical protein HPB50_023662 [Hyalomma asiaticum]|uniref:Uncharacterized protein n=1 Tax=Hyalomma asiaticum TaxID=266040 RepID=A0ACB7T6V8_HYAAI|nr:hypothetical protein HPB50_023662 [Hyalomma asiaticum]
MGQEILGRRRWRRVTVVSGSRPERMREVQQGQGAPAVPDVLGGTCPQGVPAVTVPGRVLTARVKYPNLSCLWKAGLPVWLSLLGTSLRDK